MSTTTQTSINIPQLIAVALVGFLALRWLMKPSSTSSSGDSSNGSSSSSRSRNNVDPTKIQQVSAMFPQLDRRTIAWDLHRNGQSVAATTERILTGRGLDSPPPSYQPALPEPATTATSLGAQTRAKIVSGGQPDLITRYGLQSKVDGKGKEAVASEEQMRGGWKGDKVSRAEELKRRREEMVLAARRKMMEREAGAA